MAQGATSRAVAAELAASVAEQSRGVRPGETVPGSTEVLESCFGALKAPERGHSPSGFTGLVLGLGALVGRVGQEVVRRALSCTPIEAVRRWCAENIGASLPSERRQVDRLVGATDLG